MNLELSNYLSHRKATLKPETLYRIKTQLEVFKRHLIAKGINHWNEVSFVEIIGFLEFKRTTVKMNSLKSWIAGLSGFMNYLTDEGFYLSNPLKNFKGPKYSYFPRYTPSQEMLEDLFENAHLGQKFPKRNRAILELAYSSGLRRKELKAIRIDDINRDYLKVIGKRDRERIVPLGDKTKEVILDYVKTERAKLLKKNPNEKALFLNQSGKELGLGGYSQVVIPKHYNERLTLHGFRHACATHMLENGASSQYLREFLGHQKLTTTQIYTKVSVKKLKEVIKNCHPRG